MAKNGKYSTRWKTVKRLPLGGGWEYAVGIVVDANNQQKVRIVKGRRKANHGEGECPLSQINKLNLKRRNEWTDLTDAVNKAFDQIEE